MKSECLNIYASATQLAKQLYIYINNVPKTMRFSLYQDACKASLKIIDEVYLANKYKTERVKHLNLLLDYLQMVRSRIRLLGETKGLSIKQTTTLMNFAEEISKQATGWRNSSALSQNY